MSDAAPAAIGPHIQSIVDILAQSLDRAVLLDDESLAPITHSRQFGQLDDVRMYSLLQRGILPEVKTKLFSMGVGTATEAFWTPPLPQHGMMSRFCVPICSADERFGYLWVLAPERSLSDDGQEQARRAGRDLQAVLDRRNADLRAAEPYLQRYLRGCSITPRMRHQNSFYRTCKKKMCRSQTAGSACLLLSRTQPPRVTRCSERCPCGFA